MNEITGPVGVVLAGGRSLRMGRDKALIQVAGETLVARAARLLASVCAEVGLADAGRGLLPGVRSFPDGPGAGPVAGILGAAAAYPGRRLLVVACDLPDLPLALLQRLERMGRPVTPSEPPYDWIVPRWPDGLEPLCALYGPAALAALERRVRAGQNDLRGLAETSKIRIRYLDEAELLPFGPPATIFSNLNRPEDLERRYLEGAEGAEGAEKGAGFTE